MAIHETALAANAPIDNRKLGLDLAELIIRLDMRARLEAEEVREVALIMHCVHRFEFSYVANHGNPCGLLSFV